jgi:acyl-CoA reductase-like NAD-dependent aldehyde dehydrogenase
MAHAAKRDVKKEAKTEAKPEPKTIGFFLDGQWRTEGERVEVRSPADGSVVGATYRAEAEHVEAAIRAAVRTFEVTRRMPTYERERILLHVSAGIEAQREEFARLMALEAGKPIRAARAEVSRAIFTWRVAAEEAGRIGGEWLVLDRQPSAAGRWGLVRRFPLGPIAAITPFNFPLNLVSHKWAPAIAAGCTVVHKPAPQTPLSALRLAALVAEAGWPAGALNVMETTNANAEPLVVDERLRLLTFTGSSAVGWELKRKAGKKRVALELGGNAGVIIHGDADLAYAAERCAIGGFSYAGQSCISVQRIFVHRGVKEEFLAELLPRIEALKLGDPLDEKTDVGPMISQEAARRAEQWIGEAASGGAKLLAGGKRRGSFLQPAVLTGTQREMRVSCEEVFAPMVLVEPYDEFDEALERVNDSRYGLQAGVFTSDARLIFSAYERLDVGGVIVGDIPSWRIDHMPYGGTKDSGVGREGLKPAIEEMTEPKLLVMNVR